MTLRFDMSTGKTRKTGVLGILTQLGWMQAPLVLVGGILLRDTPPVDIFLALFFRMHF